MTFAKLFAPTPDGLRPPCVRRQKRITSINQPRQTSIYPFCEVVQTSGASLVTNRACKLPGRGLHAKDHACAFRMSRISRSSATSGGGGGSPGCSFGVVNLLIWCTIRNRANATMIKLMSASMNSPICDHNRARVLCGLYRRIGSCAFQNEKEIGKIRCHPAKDPGVD